MTLLGARESTEFCFDFTERALGRKQVKRTEWDALVREGFYFSMSLLSSVSLGVNYRVLVLLSDRPLSQKLVNLPRVPRASDDCMSRLKVLGHPPCCCYCDKLAQRERQSTGIWTDSLWQSSKCCQKGFQFPHWLWSWIKEGSHGSSGQNTTAPSNSVCFWRDLIGDRHPLTSNVKPWVTYCTEKAGSSWLQR